MDGYLIAVDYGFTVEYTVYWTGAYELCQEMATYLNSKELTEKFFACINAEHLKLLILKELIIPSNTDIDNLTIDLDLGWLSQIDDESLEAEPEYEKFSQTLQLIDINDKKDWIAKNFPEVYFDA